jgi:hypothetical protein
MFNQGTFFKKRKKLQGEIIPEESSTKVHFVALSL